MLEQEVVAWHASEQGQVVRKGRWERRWQKVPGEEEDERGIARLRRAEAAIEWQVAGRFQQWRIHAMERRMAERCVQVMGKVRGCDIFIADFVRAARRAPPRRFETF